MKDSEYKLIGPPCEDPHPNPPPAYQGRGNEGTGALLSRVLRWREGRAEWSEDELAVVNIAVGAGHARSWVVSRHPRNKSALTVGLYGRTVRRKRDFGR